MLPFHTFIGMGLLCVIAMPYIHIGLLLLLMATVDLLYDQFNFVTRLVSLIVDIVMELITHPFIIVIAAIYFYHLLNSQGSGIDLLL